jgi:hypothetical protein
MMAKVRRCLVAAVSSVEGVVSVVMIGGAAYHIACQSG